MQECLRHFKEKFDRCLICGVDKIERVATMSNEYFVYECKVCGLIFTNPMPSDEFLENYYDTLYGHEFVIRAQRTREIHEIIKLILHSIDDGKRKKREEISFYEIGIGKGDFIKQIAKYGLKVRGNDLSKKVALKGWPFPVDRGRFENFKYTNLFDILYASHVLEHSNDPISLVTALHRSLKLGGIAVVRVPNSSSSALRLANMILGPHKWSIYLPVPAHLTAFNMNNLELFFRNNGFRVEKVTTLPFISNLIVFYLSILAKFFILRVMPVFGFNIKPSSLVKSKNGKPLTMWKIINLLMWLCSPVDKVWVQMTWPIFRRFDMGEEIFLIARKV